ncbi:glycine--tRNA ligase subunit beta [Aquibacillus halophilus]|uniref:Glycine--tRNA ligase beta subunit n=1 Tax=Aquibacillus halophilus TaxID=930132 RepID=A0A6A8DBK2_9BACI|nr:glycine--tRNA ligase subunit beta [Aquibacillus halophilus]MRH43095.1 glycine--tRNA ligase subunit beta [Aquibacillus halophilus]
MAATSDVLFEIGLEEMPARFLNDAQQQLETKTKKWLEELRLPYKEISTFVTPRRLAVVIKDVATKQPDIEEEAKGPARKIALDTEGNWSKAAIGFSKGQGKVVDDIYFREIKGIEYAYVNKYIVGLSTFQLLQNFKEVILSLTFPKNMRWGDLNLRYARPIRWLVGLYGTDIIPFEIAGVHADRKSFGHRFLGNSIKLDNPLEYQEKLKSEFVIVSPEERNKLILEGIEYLENKKNWDISVDKELLNEVKHLVEYPTVFFGSFSEEFLTVPEEVLITSMKEHQRYFPVKSKDGKLLPKFVAVRNGDDNFIETVARGNEKVLKARLSDARFFFEEDQKQSIEKNLEKLGRMVFQEKLGTIAEKVDRVVKLTRSICNLLDLDETTTYNAVRAAEISKFDLVTNMVNEFTELQGIMGEKYATIFGENKQVATAINEHYMPRHAKDQLPSSIEGSVVSIADKLDTIIGCLSVGIIPSGSQDPYALRRQALGILQIVNGNKWSINLESLFRTTQKLYSELNIATRDEQEIKQSIDEFFNLRASFILKEDGIDQDITEAVLTSGIGNFAYTVEKAKVLAIKKQDESFKQVQESLVRVLNIATKGSDTGVNKDLFENEQERILYETYHDVKSRYREAMNNLNALESIDILGELSQAIYDFFEHTMVMSENKELKSNRLSLLNQIAQDVLDYSDLTKILWKQQS